MTRLESPYLGAGIGALVTLIIQSSSATVGMLITLAKRELITLLLNKWLTEKEILEKKLVPADS